MRVLRTLAELRDWRRRDAAAPLHFVPTMGALHAGHQHLIRRAGQRAAAGPPRVLVSVFVNPLQFGPGEDLDRYPRDLASDQQLALAAGADGLLAPDPALLYPHGLTSVTRVVPPPELEQVLCGHARPGHFIGVATVVCRLLALVRPDRLLLGEKDWQQLVILRRVVADLGLPVLIEGVATVREEDGLACSSRNRYLDAAARARAAALPAALGRAHALQAGGQRDASVLCAAVRRDLEAAGLVVDHVAATRAHNLQAVERVEGPVLLAAAVQCGAARLIDHVVLMPRPPIVAVDGPAGAGKSTVTRALAQRLGLLYLDTGAMYRALTWWLQRQGVDPADAAAIAPLLEGLELQLDIAADGSQLVAVNGEDVTAAIRSPEVTAAVSAVAAHGC
ncbi:MAG: pantoate--beta-alanine ligase, partial [Prochlorococcaceae cyanobacterium]